MTRRLVIFADGTGNAFGTDESNVWRIYEALNKSEPDQLAYYIKGVGTSGFKPFALLDGATGFGVPSNVRKLYRFICWNWSEGVEIYMFGFSRGAFTIRTLVGLIHHEGVLPKEVSEAEPVSRAEMRRNAMAAWRSYRRKSFPTRVPTILFTRFVRDLILAVFHGLLRHRTYGDVQKIQSKAQKEAGVKFLGLFDTVEAYGVPIEELRRAIDLTIWPISFRNFELSHKVERACHALSLDDERTTFHPLRFDRKSAVDRSRIDEVWFSGVHSDVGGGYPEGQLSHEPLCWILGHISGRDDGTNLKFLDGKLEGFREVATPFGPCHDSRSGLATFYRYDPRQVIDAPWFGGAPVVHHSVAEKIAFGSERYAPVMLPNSAEVLMPDGARYPMEKFDRSKYSKVGKLGERDDLAVRSVVRLRQPSRTLISRAHDAVWLRRVSYFCLLVATMAVAALPWTAALIAKALQPLYRRSDTLRDWIETANNGLSSFLTEVFTFVGSLLPSWTKLWVDILAYWPLPCIGVVIIAFLFYWLSSSLRDRIADLAYQAWLPEQRDPMAVGVVETAQAASRQNEDEAEPHSTIRSIRRSAWGSAVHTVASRYVLPAIAIVAMAMVAFVALSRSVTSFRDGAGTFCGATPKENIRPIVDGLALVDGGFSARSLCWSSRMALTEGRTYRVWIVPRDELFADDDIQATTAGVGSTGFDRLGRLAFRRWFSTAWLHPVARIGSIGNTSWALESENGDRPGESGQMFDEKTRRRVFVSKFVAKQDGELFLYLNDAVVSLPFLDSFTFAYDDNRGAADVYVQQIAAEPLPEGASR